MNAEIKKQWVEALRSGDYEQAESVLRDTSDEGVSFCCLGVLCDLHSKATSTPWREGDVYLGVDSLLPVPVADWAGFTGEERSGGLALDQVDVRVSTDDGEFTTLAEENDGGAGFDYIADMIEEQL